MSIHDAAYGAMGVPPLMDHFGDSSSVSVVQGSTTLIDQADAILHAIEGVDEIAPDGTEVKRLTRLVDLLVDQAQVIGLAGDYTNITAIVEGEAWGVDRIESITANMQRLQLIKKVPRARRRSGYYVDQ